MSSLNMAIKYLSLIKIGKMEQKFLEENFNQT